MKERERAASRYYYLRNGHADRMQRTLFLRRPLTANRARASVIKVFHD